MTRGRQCLPGPGRNSGTPLRKPGTLWPGTPWPGTPWPGTPWPGTPWRSPGTAWRNCAGKLDEARETLRTIRAGGIDALVIDTGDGEEVVTLGGAERPLDELRRELEEARETLSTIRTGGFDALVIDTGRGEEVFALGGIERPYRLVEGLAEGARTYFRAVAFDFDGTLAEGHGRRRHAGRARRGARQGDPGDLGHRADHERVARRVP